MLEENGVTLQMTDEAVDFIATAGYDLSSVHVR